MAASTKRFTLTANAYQDVSEGATKVWFTLDFLKTTYNAVRLALGTSLPSAGTTHYQLIDPTRFPVGNENYPQELPTQIEIGAGDTVYLRADADSCEVVVHRI